jgi:4-amino-4-deoxy-L-arabinose transferase-like glycosyltransferase
VPLSSRKKVYIFLATAVLLVAVFYAATLNDKIPVNYDNGSYVVLAESLAQGKGYVAGHYPTPYPHTLHPFLFPVILAGVYTLAGMNVLAFKAVSVVLAIAALVLFILLFKERIHAPFLAWAVLIWGLNPHFVDYSHQILSDVPFIAAVLASLIFVERYRREENAVSLSLALCIILLTCTFYFRIVGGLLLASSALYIALEGRNRRAFVKSLVLFIPCALLMSLFFLRNRLLVNVPGNERVFFLKDPFNPEAGFIGLSDLFQRVADNFSTHLGSFSLWVVGNDIFTRNAGFILISLVIALGFIFYLLRERRAAEYFFIIYFIAILFWVTSDKRYVLPLLPLCILYFLTGFKVLAEFVAGRLRRRSIRVLMVLLSIALLLVGFLHKSANPELFGRYSPKYLLFLIVIAVGLVVLNVTALLGRERIARACLLAGCAGVLLLSNGILAAEYARFSHSEDFYKPAEKEYVAAARWIRQNTEEDALILCDMPPVMYLLSERKTIDVLMTSDAEKIRKRLRDHGVDYVFMDDLAGPTVSRRYLRPFIEKERELFQLQQSFGGSRLFEVKKPR